MIIELKTHAVHTGTNVRHCFFAFQVKDNKKIRCSKMLVVVVVVLANEKCV